MRAPLRVSQVAFARIFNVRSFFSTETSSSTACDGGRALVAHVWILVSQGRSDGHFTKKSILTESCRESCRLRLSWIASCG